MYPDASWLRDISKSTARGHRTRATMFSFPILYIATYAEPFRPQFPCFSWAAAESHSDASFQSRHQPKSLAFTASQPFHVVSVDHSNVCMLCSARCSVMLLSWNSTFGAHDSPASPVRHVTSQSIHVVLILRPGTKCAQMVVVDDVDFENDSRRGHVPHAVTASSRRDCVI